MTPKQREKKVVKIFDAYEQFYNAAEDLRCADDALDDWTSAKVRQALDGAHTALRELRLKVEDGMPDAQPPTVTTKEIAGALSRRDAELKEMWEGYTDESIEELYNDAVQARAWESAGYAADELFRRQRNPVGY